MVYPDQDHLGHLEKHFELLHDPDYGPILSEMGRAKLLEHIASHSMHTYMQTEGQGGPGAAGAAGAMGGPGGNPMGAAPTEGAVSPELANGGGAGVQETTGSGNGYAGP